MGWGSGAGVNLLGFTPVKTAVCTMEAGHAVFSTAVGVNSLTSMLYTDEAGMMSPLTPSRDSQSQLFV